jgi:hypothetical protein
MAPANELLQFAEYSPADGTNTAFEIAGLRHVLLAALVREAKRLLLRPRRLFSAFPFLVDPA